MIININFSKYKLNYEFILESKYNDLKKFIDKKGKQFFLHSHNCYFILPYCINQNQIDNDLLSLVGILIVYPFIGKRVKLNLKISKSFSQSFEKSGKNIEGIDESLTKILKKNSSPSLAFNPGICSLASLLILPRNTKIIYLNDIHKNQAINEYVYNILDNLKSFNYKVNMILTNLSDIIKPHQESNLLITSIPNILLSQYHNINSISIPYLSNNLHNLYSEIDSINCYHNLIYNKHQKYDFTFDFWDTIFKSVNLKLNFNLLGITEITCHFIVNNSPFKNLVNICLNNVDNNICNSCINCFKINIINHIFKFKKISFKYLDEYYNLLHDKEKEKLTSENQSMECFIYYLYINYKDNLNHSIFNIIKTKIINDNKLYQPSLFLKINSSAFKYMDSNLLNFSLNSLQNRIINK